MNESSDTPNIPSRPSDLRDSSEVIPCSLVLRVTPVPREVLCPSTREKEEGPDRSRTWV